MEQQFTAGVRMGEGSKMTDVTRLFLVPFLIIAALEPCRLGNAADEVSPWKPHVDKIAQPLIESDRVFGLVVGLLTPEGGREFHAYGRTKIDGPAPTADTRFEIGSVTKPMTALLLAQMVEAGEVALDDPVRRHLPAEMVVPRRGEREITLRELATHASGLPRMPANLVRQLESEAVARNPYSRFDAAQLAACLKEIELKPNDSPDVVYSNLGMGLLGDALAHRHGTSYAELLRTRVLEPLEMKRTFVPPATAEANDLATAYDARKQPKSPWTFATMAGAGAVRSTPADMLRFLDAQCGRSESPLAKAMRLTREKQRPAYDGMDIGLGWFLRPVGDRTVVWHNGGTGGFRTYVAFCREPAVAVAVLSTNGPAAKDGGPIDKLGLELIRMLLKSDDPPRNSSE